MDCGGCGAFFTFFLLKLSRIGKTYKKHRKHRKAPHPRFMGLNAWRIWVWALRDPGTPVNGRNPELLKGFVREGAKGFLGEEWLDIVKTVRG